MGAVVLRLVVAGWIVVTLARAGRAAWSHRLLLRTIWRTIRPRHVLGAIGLLAVVATVATLLVEHVPGLDLGLGSLVGTSSNAVFTPLEAALDASGPPPAEGPDWALLLLGSGFLLPLAALLPWLAFVEEEVFRAGLEDASPGRELLAALVFGLAHLVMLVPIGAALAIAVAGFAYGRAYRHAHRRLDPDDVPGIVAASFRPTRRARAAADRGRTPTGLLAGTVVAVDRTPERRQAGAVLASTVWHATFNTLVVLLLWAAIVVSALVGPA